MDPKIDMKYTAFHDAQQRIFQSESIRLLRLLAGVDEAMSSAEADVRRERDEYEEGERATALWEEIEAAWETNESADRSR